MPSFSPRNVQLQSSLSSPKSPYFPRSPLDLSRLKLIPTALHTTSQSQNSLKYLKLAPITELRDQPPGSLCEPRSSRRAFKLPALHDLSIKCHVSRCAFMSSTGSDMDTSKPINQDSVLVNPKLNSTLFQFLFGVFDGHGPYGHSVSNFICEKLVSTIPMCPACMIKDELADYLRSAIDLTAQSVLQSLINTEVSGSTLNLVLISGKIIICANIGDSRCILGRFKKSWGYIEMSNDHKPWLIDESTRILAAGGRISKNTKENSNDGPLRVWSYDADTPGIAMSRSIGDKALKRYGVIDSCDIKCREMKKSDKFLVIASDGLWDVLSNQEVVEIVGRIWGLGKSEEACRALMNEATAKWKAIGDHIDDISIIVVYLHYKN